MELLPDWEEYQRCVSPVCRATPAYSTNLYAPREQIERWCAEGKLRGLVTEGAALFLRTDRDFYHLYHVAEGQPALSSALARLPSGTYAADLVGHAEKLSPVCSTYGENGFKQHLFLQRMSRTHISNQGPEGEGVIVASVADAPEIAALLDRQLDPYAEQIPDVEELRREAQAGRLLLVRHKGRIGGMLMFELKGFTGHLRLWHVDERAQGKGIGRRLMAAFLSRCAQAQRLLLWVIGTNERSIAIYRHYGFEPDGLVDRIMIKHGIATDE